MPLSMEGMPRVCENQTGSKNGTTLAAGRMFHGSLPSMDFFPLSRLYPTGRM